MNNSSWWKWNFSFFLLNSVCFLMRWEEIERKFSINARSVSEEEIFNEIQRLTPQINHANLLSCFHSSVFLSSLFAHTAHADENEMRSRKRHPRRRREELAEVEHYSDSASEHIVVVSDNFHKYFLVNCLFLSLQVFSSFNNPTQFSLCTLLHPFVCYFWVIELFEKCKFHSALLCSSVVLVYCVCEVGRGVVGTVKLDFWLNFLANLIYDITWSFERRDSPPCAPVDTGCARPQRVGMLIVEKFSEIHIFHYSISPSTEKRRHWQFSSHPETHKFCWIQHLYSASKSSQSFCSCSSPPGATHPILLYELCRSRTSTESLNSTFETIHHNLSYIS